MNPRKFLKDSSLYLVGNLTRRAIGFLVVPLYTRLLTPEQFGVIELVELCLQVITIGIGMQAVGSAMLRIYHEYSEKSDQDSVISTALIGTAGIGIAVAGAAALWGNQISGFVFGHAHWGSLIAASALAVLFGSTGELALVYERMKGRALEFVCFSLIQSGFQLALNVYFVAFAGLGVWALVASKLITTSIGTAYLVIKIGREVGWGWQRRQARRIVQFGSPLVVSGLSLLSIHFADRFFIQKVLNTAEVGVYSLAYKFAFLITYLVADPFSRVWNVSIFEYLSDPAWKRKFGRVASYYFFALVAGGVILAASSGFVLSVVASPAFAGAASIIPILIFGYVVREVGDFYANTLLINRTSGRIGKIGVWCAAANMALNFLLIPGYGLAGAAWATFATWALYMVVCWYSSHQLHHIEYGAGEFARIAVLAAAVGFGGARLGPTTPLVSLAVGMSLSAGFLLAAWWSGYFPAEVKRSIIAHAKSFARRFLYASGWFGRWHRWRNRRNLTVLMFHRVLPESDPRWSGADPAWTVSDRLFAQCLDFLRRHYHLISAADILDYLERGRPLPARPLLITFDDGWADNEQCALDILRKSGAPAVVFVSTDGIGRRELWHERLLSDWHRGSLSESQKETLRSLEGANGMETREEILLLLGKISAMQEPGRGELVRNLSAPEPGPPLMVDCEQILLLERSGVAIGAHGVTHTPLTHTPAYQVELRDSRARLNGILESAPEGGPVLFSFPHGKYTPLLVEEARANGYKLLFTSDAQLNTERDLRRGLVGRISIDARDISGADGNLRPDLLAFHLFTRGSGLP